MWSAAGQGRKDRACARPGRNPVNALHGDPRKGANLMATQSSKPIPVPTEETRPYWEGCKRHELRIQRCAACGNHQFYPRLYCHKCFNDQVEWITASGRAKVLSFTI